MDTKSYTIGVEEEFMICDNKNFELIDKANIIMNQIPLELKERFSYELILSEIESNTSIHNSLKDALDEVSKLRNLLKNIGLKNDYRLGISGTHPTSKSSEQTFVNNESYKWVSNQLKYYASKNITFSAHIHIGLDNPEKIIKVINTLRRWISPMLALTCNSPFFEGYQTGMKSSRIFQFGLFPRTEIPTFIKSFSDYMEIVENFKKTKSINNSRHIWWKIRPHIDFNTIEFRVCDAQRSLQNIEMIVGLIQALIHTIDQKHDYNHDYKYEYLTDALWKASSKGLDCHIVDPLTQNIISMNDMIKKMLNYCKTSLVYFDNLQIMDIVKKIMNKGTEADMQINIYNKHGMDYLKKYLIEQVEY